MILLNINDYEHKLDIPSDTHLLWVLRDHLNLKGAKFGCGIAVTIKSQNFDFKEISVERINVVEKNGQLKMVISNKERQHPGIVNGKVIERDYPRPPGIIFFNQWGDEMGGLVYGENGENGHFGSLTWDKVKGDQTIGFRYIENENGKSLNGLQIWQQPNIPGDILKLKLDSVRNIKDEALRKKAVEELRNSNLLTTPRLFLGKSRNDAVMLELLDLKGNTRLVIKVDTGGAPKILFYDESGNVTYKLPKEKM